MTAAAGRGSAIAVLWVLFGLTIAGILFINGGAFSYSLDDAYIHLSVAEQIRAGGYGINAGEYSSPSSSILWPFLLALFPSDSSWFVYVPLVLNLLAATACLWLVSRLVQGLHPVLEQRQALALFFAFALGFECNLFALPFTGMEHSLQQLLAVASVYGLLLECRSGVLPRWLVPVLILGPLVRYESLLLSGPACLYLLGRRHAGAALWTGAVISIAVAAFSAFLVIHGMEFLPNSVLLKYGIASSSRVPHFIDNFAENLKFHQCWVLIVLALLAGWSALRGTVPAERWLAFCLFLSIVAHVLFGRFGWMFRYEAYMMAAAWCGVAYLYRRVLGDFLQAPRFVAAALLLAILAAAGYPYVAILRATPFYANDIFQRQWQMHRFAVDFHRGPVGVIDIGCVSFHNPAYVLDLFGLASGIAMKHIAAGDSVDWMEALAEQKKVDLVMLNPSFYPQLPAAWVPVARLILLRPVQSASAVTAFYATRTEAAPGIREELRRFVPTLPRGVGVQLLGENATD